MTSSQPTKAIIQIDSDKCDGCGICATACAEGAIEIIDGKARLVNEAHCDGLGACIGECPRGAISLIHLPVDTVAASTPEQLPCACPGSLARSLGPQAESALRNWPVQLALVPVSAPYLHHADLLVCADCVPFAFAGFHSTFLPGKALVVGCPKLDDAAAYGAKLSAIMARNDLRSIHVVYMEVPCCSGLVRLVQMAMADAGVRIPLTLTKISAGGRVLESKNFASEVA
ncbi:MAG: 4Fe-4S binding protein [Firmicutes bacterium]|nr:4Fe-4S binding protein [Bacillota bacterium]